MVVGSVLTASPPYAPGATNSEFFGATPGGLTSRSYTYTSGPAADGLGLSRSYTYSSGFGDGASTSRLVTRPLLHSNCALLSAPPNACKSLADTALPTISPLTRSLTTLPWRPSTYYSSTRVAPNTPLTRSGPPPLSRSSELLRVDDFKVPQVFASARNSLYTRYTPSDWANTQRQHYLTADKFRQLSESLRTDSNRLAREVDDRTRSAQDESGKKLGERVSDIEFWRNELNHETDAQVTETNQLAESKRQVERALLETENPLHIAQECLFTREKRQGIDLVHDDTERELLKEVDAIKRSQDELRQAIDRANTQLALNRAAQHELEKDATDKFSASTLDEQSRQLTNTSRGIALRPGLENVDNTVSVPESWAAFSNTNVQRSQAERAASRQLRDELDALLARSHDEIWRHWNTVNVAFTQRIAEQQDAKYKTETHLQKVLQEIYDMEANIAVLKQAIADKEAPLRVAHTRLDTRTRRPNIELCRDPAQLRLVSEVHGIYEGVERLQAKLRESEAALQHLLNTKLALEAELARKSASLFLDRDKCMGLRAAFPLSTRL